jgi:hypothetical protein
VAVAPATLVGYLTAGATPVWLLGSFAVLSLLYRTPTLAANPTAEVEDQEPAGETLSKRGVPAPPTPPWSLPASPSPVPGWLRPPGSVPATAALCWPSSRPTPPWLAKATAGGAVPRWGSGNCDHLAVLPQLRPRLRAARRSGSQADLLLRADQQPPTAPANAPASASTPATRTGAPNVASNATSAPASSGPAPVSATTSTPTSADHRHTAPAGYAPAPPQATT